MEKSVQVKPNQSLLDIILTEYGSLEAGMKVAAANNTNISSVPEVGGHLIMPEVKQEITDFANVAYLRQNDVVIGTLSLPGLGYEIVLKPGLEVVPNTSGNPHTIGYYSFDVIGSADFVHLFPLSGAYLSDNQLQYESEERYIFGEDAETAAQLSVTPMSALSIPYILPWSVGFGYMIVWSDLTQPIVTTTFKDSEGNEAYAAPMTVLDNISQVVIEQFMGDIDVEIVAATNSSIILRLTRSHPPVSLTNFRNVSMEWLGEAVSSDPDPSDPENPDKCVVSLGAGTHTIGLKTRYVIEGSSSPAAYPASAFTMVIKVH